MEKVSVAKFCEVINGRSIFKKRSFFIEDVVYKQHRLKQSYTAFFFLSYKSEKLDWELIKQYTPIVVIIEKNKVKPVDIVNCTIVEVDNVQAAYWKFVSFYRQQFTIPVIAVTGTNGKTTVKEMIRYLLQKSYTVHSSYKSANQMKYALPYLLGIESSTEVAVFETAVATPGNLRYVCKHYHPSVGIIMNIGIDHLQGCKTLEQYIKAKAEILEGIQKGGTLILNKDDENIPKINTDSFPGKIITFGIKEPADYNASHILYRKKGMSFVLHYQNQKFQCYVPGLGVHQVYNALAAVAASHCVGLSFSEIIRHLWNFKNLKNHTHISKGMYGCTIIDDTWKTNVPSIKAALQVVKDLSTSKKTIVVLGEMTDLGKESDKWHKEVGKLIYQSGIHTFITVGENAKIMAEQAVAEGMDQGFVYSFSGHEIDFDEKIMKLLQTIVTENTVLLLKNDMYDDSLFNVLHSLKSEGTES